MNPLTSTPHHVDECSVCRHWKASDGYSLVSGKCRRFPPQVVSSQEIMFPITNSDTICGEFARDNDRAKRIHDAAEKAEKDAQEFRKAHAKALEDAAIADTTVGGPEIVADKPTPVTTPKQLAQPLMTVERMRALQAARGVRPSV